MLRKVYIYFSIVVGLNLSCLFQSSHTGLSDNRPPQQPIYFIEANAQDRNGVQDSLGVEIIGKVMSSPILKIIHTAINGIVTTKVSVIYTQKGIDFKSFTPITALPPATKIEIKSDQGSVYSSVSVPQSTDTIVSHANNDTIAFGKDLIVSWRSAASFFTINAYVADTNFITARIIVDSIMDGKSIAIPGNKLTKDLTSIRITVAGFNGVKIKEGVKPNMNGAGTGYIITQNLRGVLKERMVTLILRNRRTCPDVFTLNPSSITISHEMLHTKISAFLSAQYPERAYGTGEEIRCTLR